MLLIWGLSWVLHSRLKGWGFEIQLLDVLQGREGNIQLLSGRKQFRSGIFSVFYGFSFAPIMSGSVLPILDGGPATTISLLAGVFHPQMHTVGSRTCPKINARRL